MCCLEMLVKMCVPIYHCSLLTSGKDMNEYGTSPVTPLFSVGWQSNTGNSNVV